VAAWEEFSDEVSLVVMRKRFFLTALALAVLVFALAGWTFRGVRWTLAAPARAF
jgi:hypothetical protein